MSLPSPLPSSRPRRASPWRRTGRIIGIVGTFSLATATAAAAGFFGDPVYVPGVSEALVEAKIVETPAPIAKPKVRILAECEAGRSSRGRSTSGYRKHGGRQPRYQPSGRPRICQTRPARTAWSSRARKSGKWSARARQAVKTSALQCANSHKDADPAAKEAWRKAAVERRERTAGKARSAAQRVARRTRSDAASPARTAAGAAERNRVIASPNRGGGAREARDGGERAPKARAMRRLPLHHACGGQPLPRAGQELKSKGFSLPFVSVSGAGKIALPL